MQELGVDVDHLGAFDMKEMADAWHDAELGARNAPHRLGVGGVDDRVGGAVDDQRCGADAAEVGDAVEVVGIHQPLRVLVHLSELLWP